MPDVEGENRRAVILKILIDRASVGGGADPGLRAER